MKAVAACGRRAALQGLLALPLLARAQSWPARAVRVVVPYPTGGVADAAARALAERLAVQLGVPWVVENRAGASGSLGMDAVAKAVPDGYTLAFSALSPLTLLPHLARAPFDPAKDLVPVASVMASPVLLLATPATAARDLRELLAAAGVRPGRIRWATSGAASLGHIMLEQIKLAARVDITHVPYKGGGQQITDALGGQFEVLSVNASAAVLQHVRAGRLRALAVGAPARLDALPETPTLAELGHGAANLMSLFGVFAPAGISTAIVERLNAEINRAMASPDVRARVAGADNVPLSDSAAAFARIVAQESQANARIIVAAGIRAD